MKPTLKKSPKESIKWSFVSSPFDVGNVAKNKAVLVGATAFISIRDVKMDGYTKLVPRRGASPFSISNNPPRLYVSIQNQILSAAGKNIRFAFAIDGYLNWGIRKKGKVVLLGGYESTHDTHLDILSFEDGKLTSYNGKTLPSRSASHYSHTLATTLDEISESKPGHKVYLAPPLSQLDDEFQNIEIIKEDIFKNLSFKPIVVYTESQHSQYVIPAAISLIALAAYCGSLVSGWSQYEDALKKFDMAVADPVIRSTGSVDTNLIDTIQQKRFFLDEPRRQVSLAEKSKDLVAGIGQIPGLKIVEIKLPAPSVTTDQQQVGVQVKQDNNTPINVRKPDVWLQVSMPLAALPAMEQGKDLMLMISANTGMDVRLARQGWKDENGRRIFTIEGFIHV